MAVAVMKAKRKTRSVGKRGEPGRFVTLKTGRVIFIPEGERAKWADVKDRVLASQKKETPLSELAEMRPESSTGPGAGIETTFVNTYPDGSKALWKINEYGSAEAEVLAYEFSESIGWGIVPETVMPEGTKDVSLQRWVEGKTAKEMGVPDWVRTQHGEFKKDPRILTMDLLLQNGDRHGGNILIDGEGRQWAIDNNMAFGAMPGQGGYRPIDLGYKVAKGWEGRIDAAKDVARWSKTRGYLDYLNRLSSVMGPEVRFQFSQNVEILASWSGYAKVVE